MLPPNLFNTLLIFPTINVLLFFNFIFTKIGLPGSFGFAIIALTILVRLIVYPLSKEQILLARKMEEMRPHLDKLNQKHKNDKKKLQEEQMKLYKDMGINPASGCLYAIIQIPVFIGLYQVLNLFLTRGGFAKIATEVNKIVYFNFLKTNTLDPHFFGLNLAVTPSQYGKYGVYYLAIPVITAFLQYYQIKYTTPQQVKPKKEGKAEEENMQVMMSKQMLIMFPIMIGFFSYRLPIGLALYWNIFSLFSILQTKKKHG
jgi:YidC/Oxa1 family membrane protein insertase